MSIEAAGAYLKRLREEAGLSKLALSKKVGTSDSQIIRIEQGKETRGTLLARICKELGASGDDVIELLASSDITADEGRARAEQWIMKQKKEKGQTFLHPDVEKLLNKMNDYELGRWVSMGERMIEERSKN